VTAFAVEQSHQVGALLARTQSADVVDAHVVLTAASSGATVLTSDIDDLGRLAETISPPVTVLSL